MGQWSKIAEAAIDKHTVYGSFVRVADYGADCSECLLPALGVNQRRYTSNIKAYPAVT